MQQAPITLCTLCMFILCTLASSLSYGSRFSLLLMKVKFPCILHRWKNCQCVVYICMCEGQKRPRSRSWEPQSQLTPISKRRGGGATGVRPLPPTSRRHQRSQTAGSAFSRPRKQREQFRSALVRLILYVYRLLRFSCCSFLLL